MNIREMKVILADTDIASPLEDCTELGITLNLIKIKHQRAVVYGGGLYGRLTIRYLQKYGIDVECIIDADTTKCGSYIENIKIISLYEAKALLKNRTENYIVFISLSEGIYEQHHEDIERYLGEIGVERFYFDEIWRRVRASNYVENPVQYAEDFLFVFDCLADIESKDTLMELIRCFLKNDSWILPEHMCTDKYWGCDWEGKDELYTHLEKEVWLNCGSCIGDTIFNYLGKGYYFEKIYAVEGDESNFSKLKKNLERLGKISDNIEVFHQYIGEKEEDFNIKTFFDNRKITLINADIEGAEMEVLIAAKDIIIRQKPVIAFCVYHHFDDVIRFVRYLKEIQTDYHFYLRKYVSGVYNRFMNEIVLYAVPTDRLIVV